MLESVKQRLIVVSVATSLTGCSFILTRGPAKSDPQQPVAVAAPDCTTSMSWPAVDGVLAALMLVGVASASERQNDPEFDNNQDSGDVAVFAVTAVAAGISAIVGYSRVSSCRKANETYIASYSGGAGYGQPATGYQYPPQYPNYAPQYPATYPQQYQPQQQPTYQQPTYQPVQPVQPTAQPQPPPPPGPAPTPAPPPPPTVGPAPAPPPAAQPAPRPQPPVAAQPKPAPRPPAPKPQPKPAPPPSSDASLGTEGDVCTTQSECASGFACTNNVCLKKK